MNETKNGGSGALESLHSANKIISDELGSGTSEQTRRRGYSTGRGGNGAWCGRNGTWRGGNSTWRGCRRASCCWASLRHPHEVIPQGNGEVMLRRIPVDVEQVDAAHVHLSDPSRLHTE
jgi:hypothetical protein